MKRMWPLTVMVFAALIAIGADSCNSNCSSVKLPYVGDVCGGSGTGTGSTAVPTATNTPGPTATPTAVPTASWYQISLNNYEYSYKGDSNCEPAARKDPITTIFVENGHHVQAHAVHHGMTFVDTGGFQAYVDNGVCQVSTITVATNDGTMWCGVLAPLYPCSEARWHMRCDIRSTLDPQGNPWSVCTPHFDAPDGIDPCWHFVPGDYQGDAGGFSGSGFDAGKDWIYWAMVLNGGHRFLRAEYWDNQELMPQCDGGMAGSNGWVNVIEIP